MSDFFKKVCDILPSDFCRRPRSMDLASYFKATEVRTILLYLGPVIFQDVLDTRAMKHYNELSCAIRLLCDPTACVGSVDEAKILLKEIVDEFEDIHDKKYKAFNVHVITHLAEDVCEHGDLDLFSAFGGENAIGFIVRSILKSGYKPLAQIHRRFTERAINGDVQSNALERRRTEQPILECPINVFEWIDEGRNRYQRANSGTFFLDSGKPGDCYCILVNGDPIKVSYFYTEGGESKVCGTRCSELSALPNWPVDSRLMNIYVSTNMGEGDHFVCTDILSKAFGILHKKKLFIFPLLHTAIYNN